MKIAVIGANGNLGSRVVRQALERGMEVKGIARSGDAEDTRVEMLRKSLFDLTKEEFADCDAVISAYGSGFQADPALNRDAYRKYIELNQGTGRHMIAISGAGSLYADAEHRAYCYELPEHPEFLREISRYTKLGVDEIREAEDMNWTVVCPSSFFDPEGELTGNYRVSDEGHLLYNEKGVSRVTYEDLASAMLDIAEQNSFCCRLVTVLTN